MRPPPAPEGTRSDAGREVQAQTRRLLRWQGVAAVALAIAAGTLAYLGASAVIGGGLGFPLDDSWIHQTLARNLVRHGYWGVNPGQTATASTAPLWTLLLAPGHLLPFGPEAWAYSLGCLSLAWTAYETGLLGKAVFPGLRRLAWLAMLLVPFEWHMVWSAFSGMETLLFTALSLSVLRHVLDPGGPRPWRLGFLIGLLTLTRPEGALLAALAAGWLTLQPRPSSTRLQVLLRMAAAAALVTAPYVLFNLAVSGRPLPATFYAKNAAYGTDISLQVHAAFLAGAVVELARGPLFALYPGLAFLAAARRLPSVQELGMSRTALLPLAWAAVLVSVYAWWLPVLYHHGRYLVPVIPLLLLYGMAGIHALLYRMPLQLVPRTVMGLMVFIWGFAWIRGALAYAEDVRSINQQQVRLAHWLREATPEDAVIATHDIGATGYFANRELVDIAGLVTPDLTDSPKDTERILSVLRERKVAYVALMPDWYPPLYHALTAADGGEAVQAVAPWESTPDGRSGFVVLRLRPA